MERNGATYPTSYTVSETLLAREDFQAACTGGNFAEVFRLMRKYDGASQDRIASPVEGLTQSRVSRVMRGHDRISGLDLFTRISDGLRIPGRYLGLADRPWEPIAELATVGAPAAGAGVLQVDRLSVHRSPAGPPGLPPTPIGQVTEKRLAVEIDIARDGAAHLTYTHELLNTSPTPFTRLVRELWFAVADGPLDVQALPPTKEDAEAGRNVIIQRVHETPAHLTYACQFFPALQPGQTATVAYTCDGARFAAEHYWRQAVVSPVAEYQILVRLSGVQRLTACSAVEEGTDGSETSAAETLAWRRDGEDLVITLTRRDLLPNQFVSLRWDFPRD